MKKKSLPVIKFRFGSLALSLVLLLVGIGSLFVNKGFNTGIDFESGLSQRIQVAPVGLELSYTGNSDVKVSLDNSNIIVETRSESGVATKTFKNADYATVADLAKALSSVEGVTSNVVDGSLKTANILSGYGFPAELSSDPVALNFADDSKNVATIESVRAALSDLGNVQVQTVGSDSSQIFQIRLGTNDGDTQASMEKAVSEDFANAFGATGFVVLESNFVGPRFSQTLITGSLLAVLVAMVLILLYVWVRFRIAYAISSIIALCHDVLLLLGFISLFRFEVSSTTIAAVLTIIGYSLNATIVIFDRIRENTGLQKDKSFSQIIEGSVAQSLSRTLISSLTTVIAVLPLAILSTGGIQLFAIELAFGIVIGTYSSNFIAPSFLYWVSKKSDGKASK